jgi:hypothetical protein
MHANVHSVCIRPIIQSWPSACSLSAYAIHFVRQPRLHPSSDQAHPHIAMGISMDTRLLWPEWGQSFYSTPSMFKLQRQPADQFRYHATGWIGLDSPPAGLVQATLNLGRASYVRPLASRLTTTVASLRWFVACACGHLAFKSSCCSSPSSSTKGPVARLILWSDFGVLKDVLPHHCSGYFTKFGSI